MGQIREQSSESSKITPASCDLARYHVAQIGRSRLPGVQGAGLRVICTHQDSQDANLPQTKAQKGAPDEPLFSFSRETQVCYFFFIISQEGWVKQEKTTSKIFLLSSGGPDSQDTRRRPRYANIHEYRSYFLPKEGIPVYTQKGSVKRGLSPPS